MAWMQEVSDSHPPSDEADGEDQADDEPAAPRRERHLLGGTTERHCRCSVAHLALQRNILSPQRVLESPTGKVGYAGPMSNFYIDTIRTSSAFGSPARTNDLRLLEPITRAAVVALLEDATALGIRLMVFETFRSRPRQQALFDQHATELRTVGVHHYGLAADIVKMVGNDPSWKGDFRFMVPLAKKHGLISGVDWNHPELKPRFTDACHVQRVRVEDQPRLFDGTWFPSSEYSPNGPITD